LVLDQIFSKDFGPWEVSCRVSVAKLCLLCLTTNACGT